MQTTLGSRVARVGLWVGLVWLPLLFYVLILGGDLVALGPLRGDWLAATLSFGWPILLAGLGAMLVLLAVRLAVVQAGRLPGGFWWRSPVAVGLGAYLLGCLLQLLLPSAWWHWHVPNLQLLGWEPLYWWPFFSGTAEPQGWTLLPPLSAGYALIPPAEASAIKLGALLATLALYRRSQSRPYPAPPESAASAQSA